MPPVPPTYPDRVIATGPIRYWPLWDLAGPAAIELIVGDNGAYTGVTLADALAPDGSPCPRFDGANDFVNVFSAALQAAFNGAEGSIAAWARVFNVGVWTDGNVRDVVRFYSLGTNQLTLLRWVNNNRFSWYYAAGGVVELRDRNAENTVDWFHVALTWSAIADQVIAYWDGVQEGAIMGALGVWAGLLAAATTNIGCYNNAGPSEVWNGWLAHVPLWDRALTPAEVLDVATV